MKFRCELENIVENIDGSVTYYFRDTDKDYGHKAKAKRELLELKEKCKNDIAVELGKFRKQRSLDANAYFHLLVDRIAKELNKGADEIKRQLNLDYGTIMRDEKGVKIGFKLPVNVDVNVIYPYAKWFDERVENGVKFNCYILYKETHTLDTKEMSQLIDGTVQEAQALGIETKSPEEIANMLDLYSRIDKGNK